MQTVPTGTRQACGQGGPVTEVNENVFVVEDRYVRIYLTWERDEALLIDAGFEETARMLLALLPSIGVRRVSRVVLTHGHGVHYERCAELVRASCCEISMHPRAPG